jgi:membrane protein
VERAEPSATEPPPSSLRAAQIAALSDDVVLHPRGRIWPLLPESAPPWSRFLRALVRVAQGLRYHGAFRAAPAMAFHFFLSLLPLLVFIGYVLGLVARRRGVSAVLGLLLDNLPSTTEAILKTEVSHLANADRLGPLAAAGFLWIASGGTHGLMDAVEMVVGAQRRAWWKQRLFAIGWVIGTLIGFGIAAFGIIEWDDVVHTTPDRPAITAPAATADSVAQDAETLSAAPRRTAAAPTPSEAHEPHRPTPPKRARRFLKTGGERLLTMVFSLAAAVGGLCAFYRFAVTHARHVRRRVLPGAVVAVVLWIIVSWAFSLYLRTLASYTVYYGSLAAVAVLLIWLQLMSLAILVGAELNAQLEGLRDELPAEDEG